MNNPLLERFFGPNWKVFFTGIGEGIMWLLTALSGASYQLGDVAMFIPPEWKAKVFITSAIAAAILRIIQSGMVKSKNVSGTPGTGQIVGIKGEEPRQVQTDTSAFRKG